MRRFLLLLFFLCAPAFGQPVEGRDYLIVSGSLPAASSPITVTEYFYYGCPQCRDLEPVINQWAASHHSVKLNHVPAFRNAWITLARTYYSLEKMGIESRLRSGIFSAMGEQGIDLSNESVLFGWIMKQGVPIERFQSLFFSDEITKKIEDSMRLALDDHISGVPAILVDGRYLMLGDLADTRMLDELVDIAREDRKH